MMGGSTAGELKAAAPYRVLARKYRPSTFSELIGQDAMVRTLSNAVAAGRLAHAFMLTGVRGVGKTTTARIIAKGLNCIGSDGQGGPTVTPCGVCANCVAIAESRHIDVQEMDAASRTGVGDIREIIEGVRFSAVQARFKVYIIDEVHMLSTSAFNALLKTLEEPPPHVKFIFATTEIRKVPVTVLSRCQRFDLRRVDPDRLASHLAMIGDAEAVTVAPAALAMIARAAEGSVRDALSLLDQAIAHGAGAVDEGVTRDMLGLADRGRIFDLFEAVLAGRIADALAELRQQYDTGADPAVVLQDLLELTHWLTRLKLVPEAAREATASELERKRGQDLAGRLGLPVLGRTWQMLLKGLGEARAAPSALAAAEMILVRLAFAADLPSPADLVRQATESRGPAAPLRSAPQGGGGGGPATARAVQAAPADAGRSPPVAAGANVVYLVKSEPALVPLPDSFEALVGLVEARREILLHSYLVNGVHLVSWAPDRVTLRLAEGVPRSLPKTLAECLRTWTGATVVIELAEAGGAPTLAARARAEKDSLTARLLEGAAAKALLAAFPDARLVDIRRRGAAEAPEDLASEDLASEDLAAADPDDAADDGAALLDIFELDSEDEP